MTMKIIEQISIKMLDLLQIYWFYLKSNEFTHKI